MKTQYYMRREQHGRARFGVVAMALAGFDAPANDGGTARASKFNTRATLTLTQTVPMPLINTTMSTTLEHSASKISL